MKNVTTWLAAGVIVAAAAAGCSVEVTSGDGGTAATGGTGGSGGSGGSGGTATGGTAGTGGSAGSGGSSGTGGSAGSGDASVTDGPIACSPTAADKACKACAFTTCKKEHCDCVADIGCGAAVDEFYACLTMGGDYVGCSVTFASGMTRSDAGARLAADLAECMDPCVDRCASADGGKAD